MTHPPRAGDMPREELLKSAGEVLREIPNSEVMFKFTCRHCGERCCLEKTNVLHEAGECHACGQITPIEYGGFSILIHKHKP